MRHSCVPVAVALALLSPAANAVIVRSDRPLSAPEDGFVGRWNGSSAVAIGRHWALTANHVGGLVGHDFTLNGETYEADAIHRNRAADLMLVHLEDELPGWNLITDDVSRGDHVLLGGAGRTNGRLLGSNGYDWNGAYGVTWGENSVEFLARGIIGVRYDVSSRIARGREAGFAINDSGGGLFVVEPDGTISLAGIAISVSQFGRTVNGSWSFSVDLRRHTSWLLSIMGEDEFNEVIGADPDNASEIPSPQTTTMFFALVGASRMVRRRR